MFFSRRGDQHASVTWPTAPAAVRDRPVLRGLVDRLALDLDPDELARDALAPDPLERLLADVVGLLLLDEPLEPRHLERVVSRPMSEPQSKMPASMRRMSDEGVTRMSYGLPASRMRSHRSSPRLGSRR